MYVLPSLVEPRALRAARLTASSRQASNRSLFSSRSSARVGPSPPPGVPLSLEGLEAGLKLGVRYSLPGLHANSSTTLPYRLPDCMISRSPQ